MFNGDKNKIINQIVKVSEKLHSDCRYDPEDAKLRLEQLGKLSEILKVIQGKI